MYKSDRDLPLIYQDTQRNTPIITVENYCKWYTLYVVNPDDTVEHLCFPGHDNPNDEPEGEMGFRDHVPNPKAVCKMAKRLNYDVDEISLEVITGRWHTEVLNYDPTDF